jgi:RNA polymerase primary sigma factor
MNKESEEKDVLQTYLSEISRFQLLEKEQEWELADRIQKGDQEALHALVNANLRFVVNICKRYAGCGIPLLDLINEGNIGLMEAAKRFDPFFKVKFISYAVWWVKQSIIQVLADQGSSVRIPLKKASFLMQISGKFKELCQKLGREPTHSEMAAALDVSELEVESVIRAASSSIPFDARDEDTEFMAPVDTLEDTEAYPILENLEIASDVKEIQDMIAKLDEREADILRLHFGLLGDSPVTLEEIGKKHGLTRERVRQIEAKAKKKLVDLIRENKKEI